MKWKRSKFLKCLRLSWVPFPRLPAHTSNPTPSATLIQPQRLEGLFLPFPCSQPATPLPGPTRTELRARYFCVSAHPCRDLLPGALHTGHYLAVRPAPCPSPYCSGVLGGWGGTPKDSLQPPPQTDTHAWPSWSRSAPLECGVTASLRTGTVFRGAHSFLPDFGAQLLGTSRKGCPR